MIDRLRQLQSLIVILTVIPATYPAGIAAAEIVETTEVKEVSLNDEPLTQPIDIVAGDAVGLCALQRPREALVNEPESGFCICYSLDPDSIGPPEIIYATPAGSTITLRQWCGRLNRKLSVPQIGRCEFIVIPRCSNSN